MTVIQRGKSNWNVDTDNLFQELINARGTATNLDARLSVAIADDGTLKTPTPASGWWTQEADTVSYVDSDTFTVVGDKTAIYLEARALKLSVTAGTVYAYVSGTPSYDSGTNKTTVNLTSGVLDSGLSAVYYGQPPSNSPAVEISADTSPQLGGELDTNGHAIGFTIHSYTGSGGTTTIDWTKGNKAAFTFGAGDETLAFTPPSKPGSLLITIKQDSTGGRDLTLPSSVKWLGDEPTWTDGGAGKTIIVAFYYDGSTFWAQATDWEA